MLCHENEKSAGTPPGSWDRKGERRREVLGAISQRQGEICQNLLKFSANWSKMADPLTGLAPSWLLKVDGELDQRVWEGGLGWGSGWCHLGAEDKVTATCWEKSMEPFFPTALCLPGLIQSAGNVSLPQERVPASGTC